MLTLERTETEPGPRNDHVGFNLEEMSENAERLLRDVGLVRDFASLVLLIGHGSNSVNNPHMSAYMCGACGGAAGGPNARAMARILNDARVRARLQERGICIPDTTVFVGGSHDTCNDSVVFHDTSFLPDSHRHEFDRARADVQHACQRNAHERSRRFLSASLALDELEALEHVEARGEDLAQTRPECGHATNAVCLVGRRRNNRGLFLDRRAFLVSYDPTQDDEEAGILTRTLLAVFPVCAGINLEYYFSYVDNAGWGSGTKLPHNVASLLGVMDGAASDLRTGLPWQMVEIHEPVRLVFIIETRIATMQAIMDRNDAIGNLCRNGWVHLAVQDPDTGEVALFEKGEFRKHQPQVESLPTATSSVAWYRGWRDHLEFAVIGKR